MISKPWATKTQPFGYQVDGRFYDGKVQALQAANGDINCVKLYFLDQEWSTVDWTSPPTESWQELVDRRCHQLRNRYRRLTLFFSGGYDSITILNGFIRNNISLDELIVWERPWIPTIKNEVNYALRLAENVKKYHWPTVQITHLVRNLDHMQKFYQANKDNWIMSPGNFIHPTKLMRDWEFENFLSLRGKNQNPDHGYIEGRDKPRLDFVDNKWYATMNDNLAHWIMGGGSEPFYFAEDLPELHVKQCYMMVEWLEKNFDVTHELVHKIQSHMSPSIYEQWNLAVGRDTVFDDMARYGLGAKTKDTGGINSADSVIARKYLEDTEKESYKIWKNGIDTIRAVWPDCWDNQTNGIKSVISEQHYMRDFRSHLNSKRDVV